MNFKKWVKSIQTAGYNGARTVFALLFNMQMQKLASEIEIGMQKPILSGIAKSNEQE